MSTFRVPFKVFNICKYLSRNMYLVFTYSIAYAMTHVQIFNSAVHFSSCVYIDIDIFMSRKRVFLAASWHVHYVKGLGNHSSHAYNDCILIVAGDRNKNILLMLLFSERRRDGIIQAWSLRKTNGLALILKVVLVT